MDTISPATRIENDLPCRNHGAHGRYQNSFFDGLHSDHLDQGEHFSGWPLASLGSCFTDIGGPGNPGSYQRN